MWGSVPWGPPMASGPITARPAREPLVPLSAAPSRSLRGLRSATRPIALLLSSIVVLVLMAALDTAPAGAAGDCGVPVPGEARVVVVVDDGSSPVSTQCLRVPLGTTGSQLLVRRAGLLGTAKPGHAGSGLLCTIDAFPSSGCAETGAGSYWANFSGTAGTWIYSNYNPFIRRVCDGDVEGWRYVVRGSGGAGDAAPRPDAASLRPADAQGCDRTGAGASVGAASGGGAPTGAGGRGAPSDPGAMSSGAVEAPSGAIPGADPTGASSIGTGAAAGTATTDDSGTAADAVALAPTRPVTSQSAATSWIGIVAVATIIGALALAALLRARRTA